VDAAITAAVPPIQRVAADQVMAGPVSVWRCKRERKIDVPGR
jgi:hypothetical protein